MQLALWEDRLELVLGADDGTLSCLGNAPNAPTDNGISGV